MVLKLNLWGHIRLLIVSIIIVGIFTWIYLSIPVTKGFDQLFIICILPLSVFVLPALYLHLSYYSRNSGITYNVSNEGIIKNENETDTFYGVNDFDFIEFRMTKKRRYRLVTKGSFFDEYYYAYVHLSNNDYLIITSLYPQGVEKMLNNAFKGIITIKYSCTFYPSIMDYKVY